MIVTTSRYIAYFAPAAIFTGFTVVASARTPRPPGWRGMLVAGLVSASLLIFDLIRFWHSSSSPFLWGSSVR